MILNQIWPVGLVFHHGLIHHNHNNPQTGQFVSKFKYVDGKTPENTTFIWSVFSLQRKYNYEIKVSESDLNEL